LLREAFFVTCYPRFLKGTLEAIFRLYAPQIWDQESIKIMEQTDRSAVYRIQFTTVETTLLCIETIWASQDGVAGTVVLHIFFSSVICAPPEEKTVSARDQSVNHHPCWYIWIQKYRIYICVNQTQRTREMFIFF